MPGMDGVETARLISERFPSVPVVLMSGMVPDAETESLFAGFLYKPFTVKELKEALAAAVARR